MINGSVALGVWHAMDKFDHRAEYAEGWFVIWLETPEGSSIPPTFDLCWTEDGKFMGAWRHQCNDDMTPDTAINELEPSAFMLIGIPDLPRLLKRPPAANDAVAKASAA